MRALCPSCKSDNGEVLSRKRREEGGLRVSFECPECNHQWDVTL